MIGRRALALAAWITLAAVAPLGAAAAQFFPAQPAGYLLTSDASDARALWVNPAGLVRRLEASVGADVAIERTPLDTRVSQYGLVAASRYLAFGWSHNRLSRGTVGGGNVVFPVRNSNVYSIGIGLGDPVFSAGVARRWYRSDRHDAAWDVATRVTVSPRLDLSVVWRDLGSPVVFDTTLEETLVPAVAVTFFGGRLRGAAEWHVATGGWSAREIRTGWTVTAGQRLAFAIRTDLTPGLGRRRAAFAVQWGMPRVRAALFASDRAATNTQTLGGGVLLLSAPPPARGRPRR